jgi:hypothetical protein
MRQLIVTAPDEVRSPLELDTRIGSSAPTCFRFTVITDENTYTATTDQNGDASFDYTADQYEDGSTIYLEVQKMCSTSVTEAVTYSVDGHI